MCFLCTSNFSVFLKVTVEMGCGFEYHTKEDHIWECFVSRLTHGRDFPNNRKRINDQNLQKSDQYNKHLKAEMCT